MNQKKDGLFECLWIWAGSGNVEALRAGLAKTPQLGRATHKDHGETLLVHALKNRQSGCALALIPLSNAKVRSKGGELPLALAARCGLEECVEALIPLSSPVSAKDGLFALNAATEKGSEAAARAILRVHPEWALASDPGGLTALMTALLWNEKGCARIILPYSDQHAPERGGNSILLLAARMGFGDIVRQVISLDGARRQALSGMTPLMAAATNGGEDEDLAIDCVEALLPWSDIGHDQEELSIGIKGSPRRTSRAKEACIGWRSSYHLSMPLKKSGLAWACTLVSPWLRDPGRRGSEDPASLTQRPTRRRNVKMWKLNDRKPAGLSLEGGARLGATRLGIQSL